MSNINPYRARMAKKSRRKPGDLPALARQLWGAVLHAEEVLEAAGTPELKLRGVHALVQAGAAYLRLLEVGEMESRIKEIETHLRALTNAQSLAIPADPPGSAP
jgi:hypothetical protein